MNTPDPIAQNMTLAEITRETNRVRGEIRQRQTRLLALKAAYQQKAGAFERLRRATPEEIEKWAFPTDRSLEELDSELSQ